MRAQLVNRSFYSTSAGRREAPELLLLLDQRCSLLGKVSYTLVTLGFKDLLIVGKLLNGASHFRHKIDAEFGLFLVYLLGVGHLWLERNDFFWELYISGAFEC